MGRPFLGSSALTIKSQATERGGAMDLTDCGNGVYRTDGATLIDRTGRRSLPIGDDGFSRAARRSVVIDKTMLIADVLNSGFTATLFCRPRRFGKTLNMTMMQAFFEAVPNGSGNGELFEGTDVWEAQEGRYRSYLGAFPVVYVSMRAAKGATWAETLDALRNTFAAEFARHDYLAQSPALSDDERAYFCDMAAGRGSKAQYADSLIGLMRLLKKHHGTDVVVLVDEYDAPVMAGYSAPDGGYYADVVSFLKRWLIGGLKDGGEALQLACLTGVQRISKESVFSDLNNLVVNTALNAEFDERFGFTDKEVSALAAYLGHEGCMAEARAWYDGYRFGTADVYNPWSVLNYLGRGCAPDVYWGNTSSNGVVGDLLRHADQETLEEVYQLLEPAGTVMEPLDLSVVFPDIGVRRGAVWSMLYLAGYLTTEDVALPNNTRVLRRLRIPNNEVVELYRSNIVERFAAVAGSSSRLSVLHRAIASGDAARANAELSRVFRDAASTFDLTSENGAHMLMLGLLFGVPGYGDPESNREHGMGRSDIRLEPVSSPLSHGTLPLVTVELKYAADADDEQLADLARAGLAQIAEKGYDQDGLPAETAGRVRWGIAASGKRVVAVCERVE